MYNIPKTNETKKYLLYCIAIGSKHVIREFNSLDDLLFFLSNGYRHSLLHYYNNEKVKHNNYIDNYNYSGKYTWDTSYYVKDSYGNTLDIFKYEQQIFNIYKERREKIISLHHNNSYTYRRGPVSGIHRIPHGRYFRYVRTTQEKRYNSIVEYKDFVRKKRNLIPSVYDDKPIYHDKCWKSQSKCKKQYNKHSIQYNNRVKFDYIETEYVDLLLEEDFNKKRDDM